MLGLRVLTNGHRQLPAKLSGKHIMDRKQDAAELKSQWTGHLEEAYRLAVPGRNTFYNNTPGEKKNHDVFDSTAVLGVPAFANKMQAAMMPAWRDFSSLILGPDVPREQRENARIKELLQDQTDILFSHIHHSNFAPQAHEAMQDLAISTGCYDLLSGPLGGKALRFNAIPLAELELEEGPDSTVETTYRNMNPRARNIGRLWPGAELPPKLARIVLEKPNARVSICESVIFDPDRGTYEGAAVWKDEKEVFWRASWNTNPRIVFRWSVTPGEVWGRGPIIQVLPDIKTANKVVEFILRNAALQVAGMWTATNDASLNPYNFRVVPGAVVAVQSNDQRNPTIRALERSGDLGLGFEVLQQLQDNINRALFQHLREPSDAVVSATQFAMERQDLMDQVGASFGRLQTEMVEATVSRSIDVLSRAGKMANIQLDGRTVTLKHQSPLARAQDMEDLLTLGQTLESVPQESLAIGIKIEDLAGWVAGKTGLDPRLVRDEAEKAEIQKQAAQAIEEGRQAA